MKRLKGPEIKLSDLKMPSFLVDLYWDLRDRRLLPLVALAIVAIVAVPFLLSGGSDETTPPATELEAVAPTESTAAMAVVPANPGLRDYRKRLRGRSATDPFKQRFQDSASDLAGAQLGSGEEGAPSPTSVTSTSTSTSTSTTSDETSTTKTTKTTHSEDGVKTTETKTETDTTIPPVQGGGEPDLTIYGWAIDLKLRSSERGPDGRSVTRTTTRSGIVAPAPIPSKEVQAVTFMGVNPKTGNPLLIVSDEVTSVFGDGECLSGAQACQLLEVEVGMPTTFFYGPNGDSYKINITKVDIVRTGKG